MPAPPPGGGGPPPRGGGQCRRFPDVDYLINYPFLPGGRDPMAGVRTIAAPHRVFVDGRLLYGEGDPVPEAEAVRLGLVAAPEPEVVPEVAKRGRRRAHHGPLEDRAHHAEADR